MMMVQQYEIMSENTVNITDMDIQALVDGELPPEDRSRLLAVIRHSPELTRRYAMYAHQKDLLKMWHKDN